MPDRSCPVIAWRLRVLMAERDIHTTRALRRRLATYGIAVSEPQLGRIVKALPATLSTRLLAGLCAVLEASPGELLIIPGRGTLPSAVPTTAISPAPDAPVSAPAALPPVPTTASGRPKATVIPRPKY